MGSLRKGDLRATPLKVKAGCVPGVGRLRGSPGIRIIKSNIGRVEGSGRAPIAARDYSRKMSKGNETPVSPGTQSLGEREGAGILLSPVNNTIMRGLVVGRLWPESTRRIKKAGTTK